MNISNKYTYISFVFLILLLFTSVLFGVWAFKGSIEESVPGMGQIIPEARVRKISSPMNGIVSRLDVKENQEVKKGDLLVVLDPELNMIEQSGVDEQIALMQKEIRAIEDACYNRKSSSYGGVEGAWLVATRSAYDSKLQWAKMQIDKAYHQLQQSREELQRTSELLASNEKIQAKYITLFEKGGLPEVELKNNEQKVLDLRGELNAKKEQLAANKVNYEQAKQAPSEITGNFQKDLLDRLSDYRRRIAELQSNRSKTVYASEKQNIIAPVDGYVNQLLVKGEYETVSQGEALLSIVPKNSPLQAEINVTNRDLAYIHNNQRVSLRVDALPYQKFGKIFGIVESISPSTIIDQKGNPFYLITVIPEKDFLTNNQGEKYYLKPGMTLGADFITQKKNIVDFIVEPFNFTVDRAFRDPSSR